MMRQTAVAAHALPTAQESGFPSTRAKGVVALFLNTRNQQKYHLTGTSTPIQTALQALNFNNTTLPADTANVARAATESIHKHDVYSNAST